MGAQKHLIIIWEHSGFPYAYTDVVGGEPYYRDKVVTTNKFKRYISQFAMYAAVNPVMAFGNGSWISQDQEIHPERNTLE